jgi:hypothetical protein
MNFLKGLADAINYREFGRDRNWQPHPLGPHIVAMHCYHNLVFVQKGRNDEPSKLFDRPESGLPGAPGADPGTAQSLARTRDREAGP